MKLNQEQVWDKIARPWQEFREKPLKEVADFLEKQKGRVIDLGCGTGRHFINQRGLKIYGVDFSKEMIKRAEAYVKKENLGIILKKASAEKIPYKDDFFDAAIFIATLHCIETKKKRKKTLRELKRVLKPGGEALITVWSRNQKRVKNKPKESQIPWTIGGKKYYRYYYIYEKKELTDLLKEAGFKILKIWEDININVIVSK